MADTFWSGFGRAFGPALQQGQESRLKQRMLALQMQEYEARQKKIEAEAQIAEQHQQLMQQWQTATTPEEKQYIMQQGAMLKRDYKTLAALSAGPAKSIVQQMQEWDAYQSQKGGGGASPYEQQTTWSPTFDSEGGGKITGSVHIPTGKLGEVGAYLQSIGADPYDRAAQVAAMQAFSASGEAQVAMLQSLANQYGGRGGQPQQGGYSPQQPTALDSTGRTYGAGGGGSPYDVIRQKETADAIRRAGGSERARSMSETMSQTERQSVGIAQTLNSLLSDLGKAYSPKYTGVESIGGTMREKTGLMGKKETQFRSLYNQLRRMDVRASAGLSQTATELSNAIDALGEPGLSDEVFAQRLSVAQAIAQQGQAIDEELMTAPRGQVPGILQQQRQERKPYAGPSVGSTVSSLTGLKPGTQVRDKETGAILVIGEDGRPQPMRPQ